MVAKYTPKYTQEQREQVYKMCIEAYGEAAQTDMAVEEMSELIKALMKIRRATDLSRPTAREDIIDEIADVTIMTRQLEMIYKCEDEVKERIDYKIFRQIDRLAEYDRATGNKKLWK